MDPFLITPAPRLPGVLPKRTAALDGWAVGRHAACTFTYQREWIDPVREDGAAVRPGDKDNSS